MITLWNAIPRVSTKKNAANIQHSCGRTTWRCVSIMQTCIMVGTSYLTPRRHVALRHVFTHISHGCKKPLHPASPRSPCCDNLMNFLLLWKKIRSSLAGTLPYYLAGVSFSPPLCVFFYSFPFFSARFSWVCLFPDTKSAAESLLLFSLPAIWFLPRRIFRAGDKQQGLAGKHSRAKPNTSEVNQKEKGGGGA